MLSTALFFHILWNASCLQQLLQGSLPDAQAENLHSILQLRHRRQTGAMRMLLSYGSLPYG